MKKFSKITAILMILVSITTMFTGCSSSEMNLFQAMLKSQTINSMEATTNLAFKLDLSGFSEEEMKQSAVLVQTLNNLNLSMTQKMVKDIDTNSVKAEIKAKYNIGALPAYANLWVETGVKNGQPNVKEVFQLPPFFTQFIPGNVGNKEYIVLDTASLPMQTTDKSNLFDYEKMTKLNKEIIDMTSKFCLSYAKNLKPDFEIVKFKSTQGANGKLSDTYQLKISDTTLKKLISFMVNDLANNKDNLQLIKDYVYSMSKLFQSIDPNIKIDTKDLDKSFSEFEKQAPELIVEFNKFMESIKDVTILGEKGIDITYTVDDRGYIVKEAGVIDLSIDLGKIAEVAVKNYNKELPQIPTGKIGLLISTNTEVSKINEKVDISIPDTTKDNSIYFQDLIGAMFKINTEPNNIPFPDKQINNINVFINNNKVNFNNEPIFVNGKTLVPVKEIFQAVDGTLDWNPIAQTVTANVKNKNMVFTVGSTEALIDGKVYELDVPVILDNDRVYIPLRFLAESLGGEVQWIDEASAAFISIK